MERRIAKDFYLTVQALFPDEEERDRLYVALRRYQSSSDLEALLGELRAMVNTPVKLALYDDIRPLIQLKHQILFHRLVPHRPTRKLRIIRLRRKPSENLGFSVRGGLEHGIGIFISAVCPDSQAYKKGLRVGDVIVRVNGFSTDQAIHDEFLNLVKCKLELVLKVKRIGMLPIRDRPTDPISWVYVEDSEPSNVHVPESTHCKSSEPPNEEVKKVKLFVNMAGAHSLGCSICSGPPELPGIYIQAIKLRSLAEEAGLEVGDQILSVNSTDFSRIKHSEAVVALKSSRQLTISLKKGAGRSLFVPRQVADSLDTYLEEEKHHQIRQMLLSNHRAEQSDKESQELIRQVLAEEARQKATDVRGKMDILKPLTIDPSSQKDSPVSEPDPVCDDKRGTQCDRDALDTGLNTQNSRPSLKEAENFSSRQASPSPSAYRLPAKSSLKPPRSLSQSPIKKSSSFSDNITVLVEEADDDVLSQNDDDFDPSEFLSDDQLRGRHVRLVYINLDGGSRVVLGSGGGGSRVVLGSGGDGRVIFSEIPDDVTFCGGQRPEIGDEILMVYDRVVNGLPVRLAQKTLDDARQSGKNRIRLVLATSTDDRGSIDTHF